MATDKSGGAAAANQMPPKPPRRPKAAPEKAVQIPKYVHPANRKEGQA
jgi:hypothetical protein